VESHAPPVIAPPRAAIQALAVGDHAHRARVVLVPVDLRVLVAALVLEEHEAGSHRRLRGTGHGDRLAIEGELLARGHGRGYAMQLFYVAKTCGHQQGTIRQPVDEARAAGIHVFLQPRRQGSVHRRNVVEDEVALFHDSRVSDSHATTEDQCQE
jgi:hypothetical protein